MGSFKLHFLGIFFLFNFLVFSQKDFLIEGQYNDPSLQTQKAFVNELLYVAGYVPEEIQVYQTLPNHAHVFRVKLDSVTGGFMFVRWDKEKKEHYIANKMIDPGLYYNLKSAREIMRKQTQKASFSVEDGALQASDQELIRSEDLQELREVYDEKELEKKDIEKALDEKIRQKEQRKIERKSSKKN
ncbi:MAG: hypothetical protein CMC63_05355 [Flavobacteriaceae bacterium]|jgi:hypothetical protein|nr:hypothetical protein [Flavobacteriaceae bacterium]|tara:strand:- start:508 stop:1065 length:558 start_codon:yes stop_codon:yes gene_type:complete